MSDPSVDRQGIHIPQEVAEASAIPDELNADAIGDYRFPDPRGRRVGGWIYLGLGLGLAVAGLVSSNRWWVGATIAAVLGGWHLVAGWPLLFDQEKAVEMAAQAVGFPVGHASAAVTFRSLRSRPRWHVILYSADSPPTQRALVELDAVAGDQIGEVYVERLGQDSA